MEETVVAAVGGTVATATAAPRGTTGLKFPGWSITFIRPITIIGLN